MPLQPMKRVLIVGVSLVLLAASVRLADAATRTVAKDGSGGFGTIQEAVNASAPGDTVYIQPGEYDDFSDFQVDCCQSLPTNVGIAVSDLTIIGAHRDSVVIGPVQLEGNRTVIGMRDGASWGFRLESVTVRNGVWGLRAVDDATIVDVSFEDCGQGALAIPETGVTFDRCIFTGSIVHGIGGAAGGAGIVVRECSFIDNRSAINCTSCILPIIEDSTFEGGITSIVASGFAVEMIIRRCQVIGGSNVGIAASAGSTIRVYDTRVDALGRGALHCSAASGFEARRSIFTGGSSATVLMTTQREPIDVRGNSFSVGTAQAVRLDGYPDFLGHAIVDLSGNYWGTADADSIASLILDSRDDPTIHGTVEFEPFLVEPPVATEQRSFSDLKALFGNQN